MKAIVELTPEEMKKYTELQEEIEVLRLRRFVKYITSRGYAHYTFEGEFSQEMVDFLKRRPTEEEIIIIVDGGFSHFGASCIITGNKFRGRVNTD